jgi:hypothetical protein
MVFSPRASYIDRAIAICTAKLVPNFADREERRVVSVADPLQP